MSYQVWTKEEFEGWKREDCEDLETALAKVLAITKQGKDPTLTVEVPFEVGIQLKAGGRIEVTKGKTKHDKDSAGQSDGKVRRGDPPVTPGLDQGSGDNRADNLPGD